MELRCENKLHGIVEAEVFETACGSRFCGASNGVVVLHRFNVANGQLMETKYYKNPDKEKK